MDLCDENINWLMHSALSVEKAVKDEVAIKMRAEEDRQLSLFMDILREAFDSEPTVNNPNVFGVLKSFEEFSDLLRNLKAIGYFFSIRTSRKKKSNTKKIILKQPNNKNSGHPYTVEKSMRLYCSAGRNHKKEVRKRAEVNGQQTKVTDCKAVMVMKEVNVFNTYTVSNNKINSKVFKNMKILIENKSITSNRQIWVWVSLPKMHHHSIYLPGRDVDADVKACMLAIIKNKHLTVQEIKTKLAKMVEQDFADKPVKPESNNTAFYPSEKVIYNHVRHEGIVICKRQERENVAKTRNQLTQSIGKVVECLTMTDNISELKRILTALEALKKEIK